MYKNVNGKLIEMTEAEIAEEKQKIQLAKAEEKSRPLTAEEVTAMLIRQQINGLTVDDNTAPRMREFYPEWAAGVDYTAGYKVQRGVSLHQRYRQPGVQRPCRSGGAVCKQSNLKGEKQMKNVICAIFGIVGGFIANAFGGWSAALTTLLVFMMVDYASGLIVAGVFHVSPKSENGALESRAGWKGLIRKCMTLLAVLIGARLDILLATAYIKDAMVIAFCVNELLSIIENWGLMGLPMPKIMTDAVELLKAKGEKLK